MSSILSAPSNITSSPGAAAAASGALPQQTLSSSDFIQLMNVQFQEQDPMQPMDDSAFLAQMAQFTSLQQTQQMSASMSSMSANNYLGLQVSVTSASGATTTGVVTGVDNSGATPQLLINGSLFPIANVQQVADPSLAASPAASPTGN
jgi:flagellar basal-body rod modification protein FlgD